MNKQEKLNLKSLRNIDKILDIQENHQNKEIYQVSSQSMELKPWNQKKFARLTARINYKKMPNDIITQTIRSQAKKLNDKSKRATESNIRKPEKSLKPRTAPNHSSFQIKQKKHIFTEQMSRFKPVTDQIFQEEFFKEGENTNYYPKFRCSMNQRSKLLFLKPYIKQTIRYKNELNPRTFDGMQKLKTILYNNIKTSEQNLEKQREKQILQENEQNLQQKLNTNRSVYEYLTDIKQYATQEQYERNSNADKSSQRRPNPSVKTTSLSVLKQKLKNKYKQSKYAEKMIKIKNGKEIPIAIIF